MKRFLLIGEYSSGKTCFINYVANFLSGENNPDKLIERPSQFYTLVNDGVPTIDSHEYYFDYRGEKLSLIDTPSLTDVHTLDIKYTSIIEAIQKNNSHLNGFLIILNGTFVRPSQLFINLLLNLTSLMKESTKELLFRQSILVLTNCDQETKNFDEESIIVSQDRISQVYLMQNNFLKMKNRIINYQSTRRHLKMSLDTIKAILDFLARTNALEINLNSTALRTKISSKNSNSAKNGLLERIVLKRDLNTLTALIIELNKIQEEMSVIQFNLENIKKDYERVKLLHRHDYIEPLIFKEDRLPVSTDLKFYENSIKTCTNSINKLRGRIAVKQEQISKVYETLERKVYQMKGIVNNVDLDMLLISFQASIGKKNNDFVLKLESIFKKDIIEPPKTKIDRPKTVKNEILSFSNNDLNLNDYNPISDSDNETEESLTDDKLNELNNESKESEKKKKIRFEETKSNDIEKIEDIIIPATKTRRQIETKPILKKREMFLNEDKHTRSYHCAIL